MSRRPSLLPNFSSSVSRPANLTCPISSTTAQVGGVSFCSSAIDRLLVMLPDRHNTRRLLHVEPVVRIAQPAFHVDPPRFLRYCGDELQFGREVVRPQAARKAGRLAGDRSHPLIGRPAATAR